MSRGVLGVLVAVVALQLRILAQAPEIIETAADAPPNQAIVGNKLGGRYFAPEALKESYDKLVSKVRSLETEVREGRITSAQAQQEIEQLQKELTEVREQIERQKTFVPAGEIHTQSDSISFKLGPDRRILILATKVRIIGWDKPEVKCVLDKTVLTPRDQTAEKHFEQIQVVHEHRTAAEIVGKTPEELEAEHAKFLQGPEAKELTPEQLAWRQKILDGGIEWRRPYAPLQGHTLDVISLKGFSHQDGNRQILLKVQSRDGEGSHSSVWQRHADLTLYVPECEAIAVQGGLRGIEVEGVKSSLILRGDDDRDYNGQFKITNLQGPLTAEGVPLQSIEGVHGHVDIRMTEYLGNSGTRHADNTRTSYVYKPEPYSYKHIVGNFRGRFVRADLELKGVYGQIDVENEYGQTKLVLEEPLFEVAHRVISHGGDILVQAGPREFGKLPVVALTECGFVRVGAGDRLFESVSGSRSTSRPRERRGWSGFVRKTSEEAKVRFFEQLDRIEQILAGGDRSAGLDLISRGGSIQFLP
jgi:hypothetical protein